MASSSSASNSQNCPRCKYNVFLSFRGEDTRRNFMSHLYQGLENRGIFTFLDDKRQEDGDSISEELMKGIEESQVAVIIFSKNYATSSWCLNELEKIMECKEKENGHMTVIPVFCNVDASHVRYQSESFEEAFAKHESRYKDDAEGMQKVQRWRTSLTAAANLKGYVFPNRFESDADCIKHIVDQISSKCNTSVSYLQDIGPMAVEAIWFTYSEKPCFSKDAMKNMQMLRILHIFPKDEPYFHEPDSNCQDGSIEYLSNNLRWFAWFDYPWKSLPENFNPRRLVHLDLSYSSLHYLWNETKLQQFPSLQRIDLSGSKSLKRTPDFEGMPNLEYLNLRECRSLEEVHPSLKYCKKLMKLNLYECESLERFPYVNVESLESLSLKHCSSLEKFPEIRGRMKQGTAIKIMMSFTRITELPLSYFDLKPHVTELDLSCMDNLVSLLSSICKLKGLVRLNVSYCSKLKSLPEEIGDLENLEKLDASYTLISRPPSSIVRLNKLKSLYFRKKKSEDNRWKTSRRHCLVYFMFPLVYEGLLSLESLDLSYCNIIDGRLPEDIGSLSSLKVLLLSGNNFEHLPRSIAQLGALEYLDLSNCKRLTLVPEDIGCLSSLKHLNLSGDNFEHFPQRISELGALRSLNLSDCKRLTQLPEFPQQLCAIYADWSNDSFCNSLFQNISSLQHDICSSDSLSLRAFMSWMEDIPSWFHHQAIGASVSVNLPENWYEPDKFLGFAVCYSGDLIECITTHLIPLCDDGMSSMTQQFAISNDHSEYFDDWNIQFLLVPLDGLWDASNANEKTPNDYRCIKLDVFGYIDDFGETDDDFGEEKKFGVRLLYKNESELCIGIRKSRYEEEATCSSSMKLLQRYLMKLCSHSFFYWQQVWGHCL